MRYPILALAALSLLAPRADAQARGGSGRDRCPECDSIGIEIRGDLHQVIQRIARDAAMKRRVQVELTRQLEQLVGRGEAPEQRARALLIRSQLAALSEEGQALRQRLSSLCNRIAKPQGWAGVTLSIEGKAVDGDDGPFVYEFESYPTVVTVEPGSPAEDAGLRAGDVMLALGARDLQNRTIVLSDMLRPGSKLPVRVRRDGRVRSMTLVVGERPGALAGQCPWIDATLALALEPAPPPPEMRLPVRERERSARRPPRAEPVERARAVATLDDPRVVPVPSLAPSPVPAPPGGATVTTASVSLIAGAQVARMNEDLHEVFGVSRGLLVLDVSSGTPAARAGLRGGDVIVRAGRRPIATPSALQRAVAASDDGSLELRIIRKGKPLELTLEWNR